jgi:phospholipid/cholesterol/gamma-HCH transport system ATP-binding protein
MAAEREIVVEFDNVSLGFEDKAVLQDISFRLERGETKIVMGVTGAGKSVLLKLAMGLLRPDSGSIFVFGQDITKLAEAELFPIRHKMGMVFQEGALFDSLTVGENVSYVFQLSHDTAPDEIDRRVREALRFVELEQTMDQFPSALSGGMRRRVSIARAIVSQPEMMLYDSPTAGLDPITASRIMALVVKQRDLRQVSSLLVTHRVPDAYLMALSYYDAENDALKPSHQNGRQRDTHTRFLLLREGEIAFHGTLEDAKEKQRTDSYLFKFLAV